VARTAITPTPIVRTGVAQLPTPGAADGHSFVNDGKTICRIANGGASARSVTFITQQEVSGLAVADQVVSIPAGAVRIFGTFSPSVFNVPPGDPDAGKMYIDYEAGAESDLEIELYVIN
jgi:hypothetical protein